MCLPVCFHVKKAYLEKRSAVKRKAFVPRGANSFLSDLTPVDMRGRNIPDRIASHESVSIHLKILFLKS